MEYIIMADGRGSRWRNSDISSKCMLSIAGESLLARTSRLLHTADPGAQVTITTHDTSIAIPGARVWQPRDNLFEIDRFTAELLKPGVCYLYGDTFYSEAAIQTIVQTQVERVLFFGSREKIFAVKIRDDALFRQHFEHVRGMYLRQEIREAIGWEVYHDLAGLPLETRQIGRNYVILDDETTDFNTRVDYLEFLKKQSASEAQILNG